MLMTTLTPHNSTCTQAAELTFDPVMPPVRIVSFLQSKYLISGDQSAAPAGRRRTLCVNSARRGPAELRQDHPAPSGPSATVGQVFPEVCNAVQIRGSSRAEVAVILHGMFRIFSRVFSSVVSWSPCGVSEEG
ncbi:hypothetical protein MHYP_G00230850 [Metynnis hypsauchen]